MHPIDRSADAIAPAALSLAVRGPGMSDQLGALRNWLVRENALRGRLELRRRPGAEGEMGALADVLLVALGAGGTGAVVARSMSTWLVQRRSDVTITVTAPDGRQVHVDVQRARNPVAVIREVEQLTAPERE
ncbi:MULTISPECIES: effector-associated constant component EACC1 [Actinoalloteichus]|uniref:Uncharacterized protein n=1 Tax=Actinoalloteichus fjordicus TaxID=1612552 RepID=A0AAC9LBK3_9PSEU|nr:MULTISPECIES: hypothetical protein [Actinoalloteichus]APU14928.1 hypothetical protein UA74_14350 [Actinoalloteichus fjordicus]APU20998.1 hypothetical protein UA75_14940 [Actinoalloteichus sp. GBA129-24]